MSPESIMYRKYTIDSDCWSFGILLWEVLTYGKQPWFEYSNLEVIQNVTRGKQLSSPENCLPELKELMQACWQFNPTDRIPISKVHVRLKQLILDYEDDNLAIGKVSQSNVRLDEELVEENNYSLKGTKETTEEVLTTNINTMRQSTYSEGQSNSTNSKQTCYIELNS